MTGHGAARGAALAAFASDSLIPGCASPMQSERLLALAALRRTGLSTAQLDDLLAILEELDDEWAASDRRGALEVELQRLCDTAARTGTGDPAVAEAVATLRRQQADLRCGIHRPADS